MKNESLHYWADQAARLLYAHGARRVWAFGSFGEGGDVDLYSDADLAVEGIPLASAVAVLADLRSHSPHKIDVMALEELSAQMRWFVRRGTLLARDGPGAAASGERLTLQRMSLQAVHNVLREAGARSVLDLGCGAGRLVELSAADWRVECVRAVDRDEQARGGEEARPNGGSGPCRLRPHAQG